MDNEVPPGPSDGSRTPSHTPSSHGGGGGGLPPVGRPMPNADRAYVPEPKLVGFILDKNSSKGASRAEWLEGELGLTLKDWRNLERQLLDGATVAPVAEAWLDRHGVRMTVLIELLGTEQRRRRVTTGWIQRETEPGPQFVTLIPNR